MKLRREVICSQQLHCLSCPLTIARTGKDCRELTAEEIMKFKEENEMSDTDMLYMASLEKKIEELEAKHINECAQIARYSDELRKAQELLKAACEDIKYLINHAERNGKACDRCKYGNEMYCYADDCRNDAKWRHEAEALALIGKDGEQNG